MSERFSIGVISDPHIGEEGEIPYDIDVRGNFLKVIDTLIQEKPDLIVVTGDLCFREADPSIYKWIKDVLDKTHIPYYPIAGNHDNSVVMAEAFELSDWLQNGELYYQKQLLGNNGLFLDTSKAVMSESQMLWLKAKLSSKKGKQIIFMHHPPCKSQVEFMDSNYPFKMEKEFLKTVNSSCHNALIFCGHYHTSKTVIRDNLTVFLTDSTFFSINCKDPEFRKAPNTPGWRLIEITEDSITTSMKYLKEPI